MKSYRGRVIPCVLLLPMFIGFCMSSLHAQPASDAAKSLPTIAQLHEMYDAGDYRACLQQVARLLRLRGEAAAPYDRDQLQLLRGEALISLGDPRTAKRGLDELIKSESTAPEVATRARGLVTLLAHSKGTTYVPRTGTDRTPIDFTDPKGRTRALNALLDDEIDAVETASKPALAADDLKRTIELAPRVLDLNAAERLATGDDKRTHAIGQALGDHARTLITRELKLQEEKIAGIESMANSLYDVGRPARSGRIGGTWGVARRGLTSEERNDLYDLIAYLNKIEETSRAAQRMSKQANGDVDAWESVVTQATQVTAHAQAVLDAEGVKTVGGN